MKGLKERSGWFYLRKHVPERLRPAFKGAREVWLSLGTRDRREAERRFHLAMTNFNAELEAARKALAGVEAEAEVMASPRITTALDGFSALSGGLERPRAFAPVPATPDEEDFVARALELGNLEARPRSRAEAAAMVRQAIEQLEWEREDDWSLMREDPAGGEPKPVIPARYLPAAREFVQAQFEATRRTLEALLATFEAPADDGGRTDNRAVADAGACVPSADGLRALAAVWEVRRNPARSSRSEMKTAIGRFERINGALPYQAITPAHVLAFKNDLLADKAIKSGTKTKLWSMIKSAMTLAEEDGLIENPFAKVKLGRLVDDAKARDVFSRDDLRRVFDALDDDEEWWLTRLALYTGARLGELHQLEKGDLITEADALFLNIYDDDENGKSVKTRNSVRKVPVHRQLLADGLAEWVGSRPTDRLFSGTAAAASKRLNRRFDDLKLDEGKVFHSLRHTFITAARRVMDEGHWERITGHASQKASRNYGGVEFADIKAKIDLVSFGIEPA